MEQPYFTIFTAVYNKANHIDKVFKSVRDQIFKNFEWIIVNDGSTDNSPELIKLFINENQEIRIKYLEQVNSGKHIAWNNALKIAEGKLIIPVDADDSFLPESLEFFYEKWNCLSESLESKISGINVLCYDNDTFNIVGDLFPKDGLITNNVELCFRFKVEGDKWGCIRTDLLQRRPFPIIEGSFYPENYLWFELAKHYSVVCYNKPLLRYYTTIGGISNTLSGRKIPKRTAKIFIKYNLWLLSNFGFYILRYSPLDAIKTILRTLKYSLRMIYIKS